MDNKLVFLIFILSSSSICGQTTNNCPISSEECSQCQAEAIQGYELWCPDHEFTKYTVVYLSNQLKIEYHETQLNIDEFVQTFNQIQGE